MKRFKKPKKEKPAPMVPTEFLMKVIMPCVMLACKDEFKIKDPSKLEQLGARIQQNINFISNDMVTKDQLHEFMEIRDTSEATEYFDNATSSMRTKGRIV